MDNTRLAFILFFIADCMPTPEDFDAADKLNAKVVFRNASAVPDEGTLEQCDGVAGEHIPQRYAEAFPTAEEAIKAKKAERQKRKAVVNDDAPPADPTDADAQASTDAADTPTASTATKAWGAGAKKAGS